MEVGPGHEPQASRLALAPETAKNHWVARKAAACQYLIPLLLSFFVSPFSSLRPFFFHWSYSLFYSIPSTNSRGNPFSYSSYFTITISGSSRFSSPYRTLFGLLLNISALHERTRASTHIWSSYRLIGSFLAGLRLSWRLGTIAFVIVLLFMSLSIAIHALLNLPRAYPFSFYEIQFVWHSYLLYVLFAKWFFRNRYIYDTRLW